MVLVHSKSHIYVDLLLSISGIVFCIVVIYSTTTMKSKQMKMYRIMLLCNMMVDLLYAINNLCTMVTCTFGYNTLYFMIDTPLLPNTAVGGYIGMTSQLFLMFLSVTTLPIQFIYRYFIMKGKPLTHSQLFAIFCVAFAMAAFHGFLTPFTFDGKSLELDKKFRASFNLSASQPTPIYVVGDVSHFGAMEMHFINIVVVIGACYLTIVLMIYKTTKIMEQSSAYVTNSTRAVQNQMALTMYLQAVYPLIVMCIPAICFVSACVSGLEVPYLGEWSFVSMHTPPVFNSLAVVCCLPAYRRHLLGIFCCSRIRREISAVTLSKKSSAGAGSTM